MQDLNNSITRYVKNNFGDGPRQDAFDLFLGVYLPSTDNVGSNLIFVDRRPPLIQSIPYVLAASIFLVSVASLARPSPDGTAWPLRLFSVLWLVVGSWCLHFIYHHGMLYVSIMFFVPNDEMLIRVSGELAQTQHASMGNGGLSRSIRQCSKRQALGTYCLQARAWHESHQSRSYGGGEEEDPVRCAELCRQNNVTQCTLPVLPRYSRSRYIAKMINRQLLLFRDLTQSSSS